MSIKKSILEGTGDIIAEIKFHRILHDPACSVTHQDLSLLTSYDLLPKENKTIIVPGSPPVWAPKPLPLHIPADEGVHPTDPVREVFPSCPLEPLFRALEATCPTFNLKGTDLITDRRHLRLLLGYVGGSRKEFRIDAEVVGTTVMFSIWSVFEACYVDGSPKSGYGRNFEKMFTRVSDCSTGSITHNRAISYTFGGIKMILRFEVDGCIESNHVQSQQPPPGARPPITTPTGFRVVTSGLLAAPESIAELKTTRTGKNLATSSNIAQLWFSRTPNLLMGYHRGEGTFSELAETNVDVTGKLDQWEQTNTEKLQKLVKALEMIQQVLRGLSVKKCAIILQKGAEDLQIYELDDRRYVFGLPADIKAKWD